MYSVTVLTPRGRRQQVKITPNTTLLQILEEVCTIHGLNATKYDLRHHNQILDVSSMFRFTSLPNNAQLEMIEASRLRQESPVTLGLQLESGERLTGTFKPSDTVWHVIISLRPEEETTTNLVVIYMRQEISGEESLTSTTLRSLGLTGGRAMLRLIHRDDRTQAKVTTPLPSLGLPRQEEAIKPKPLKLPPQKSEKTDLFPNKKESLEKGKSSLPEPAKKTSNQASTWKPAKSENYNFKGNVFGKLLQEEKTRRAASEAEVAAEEGDSLEVERKEKAPPPEAVDCIPVQKDVRKEDGGSSKLKKTMQANFPQEINEANEESSKIVLLGERNAVAYNLNSVKPVIFEEEPDDFYDLTISDAKMLLKGAKQLCAELEDAPLMTAAQRELEKDKRVLLLLNQYKKTVIRVKFPDRTVLQGTFSPVETIAEVEKFVAEYLEDPKLKFYLYTTPPKVILKPEERLIECGCVPSSVVYLGMSAEGSTPSQFLNSDVLNKLSTPSAAALTAFQSRGMVRKANEKVEEGEKRKWTKNEINENPGPSGSRKCSATAKEQFKCPKWFKPNK